MEKIIIFDFDGVLADSVDSVFKMNEEAARAIGKTLTKEQYRAGFEGHINERLAALLHLTEEEKEAFVSQKAILFPDFSNIHTVKLFEFAKDLVTEVSKLGELWIVSSSPRELIIAILEHYGLTGYFSQISGQNRQPKHLFLEEALAKKDGNEIFFITDTTGDLKAVRKVSVPIRTLAVTWGFHDAKLLLSEKPDLLVERPKEILEYIGKGATY